MSGKPKPGPQAYSRQSKTVLKAIQAYSSLIKAIQGYLKKIFYEIFGVCEAL